LQSGSHVVYCRFTKNYDFIEGAFRVTWTWNMSLLWEQGVTMESFSIKEIKKSSKDLNIVVVGVGGGGCNMLSSLADSIDTDGISLIAMNTDKQALDSITDEKIQKLQIGKERTKGLG